MLTSLIEFLRTLISRSVRSLTVENGLGWSSHDDDADRSGLGGLSGAERRKGGILSVTSLSANLFSGLNLYYWRQGIP